MTEFRSEALIALGGNLPIDAEPPQVTLSAAISMLSSGGVRIGAVSRFFRTPCFPAGAGPDYVNAAIQVDCDLSAPDLLMRLHQIENSFARVRDQRWGMRTLDLDLLAISDLVLPDRETYQDWLALPLHEQMQIAPEHLILPHPRLQDRGFVLVPLCDIAPDWQHPVLKKTAAEMLAGLPEDAVEEVRPL